jgi:hypothetical protein
MIVSSCENTGDDDDEYNDEGTIAPWRQTRWLVLSSGLFCFPAYMAYRKQRTDLALLLASTSFVSANYWRCARPGWRRTLDLVYGKLSFFTFFCVWARSSSPHGVGFEEASVFVPLVAGLYTLSDYTHRLAPRANTWWQIHGLFHICLFYGQCRVLSGILPR